MTKKKKLRGGRFEFVTHRGVYVAVLNFSHCGRDEAWSLWNSFRAWLGGPGGRSARILVDFEDGYYDPALVTQCRRELRDRARFVDKVAFVHAGPFASLLIRLTFYYAMFWDIGFEKKRTKNFETVKSALEWLIEP